jgi:hypothetical protein
VSPWGEEIRSEEEIINVDIDFNYVKKIRKKFLLK